MIALSAKVVDTAFFLVLKIDSVKSFRFYDGSDLKFLVLDYLELEEIFLGSFKGNLCKDKEETERF